MAWIDGLPTGDSLADYDLDGSITSSDISAFIVDWLDAVADGC